MNTRLLFLVVLMLSAPWLQAKEIPMIDKEGQIIVGDLRSLTEEETKAYESPGTEIPINISRISNERLDFWHIARIEKYNEVLVCESEKIQTIQKSGEITGQPEFAFYVLFCLVSIVFMAMFNFLIAINKDERAVYAVSVAFVVASVAGVAYTNYTNYTTTCSSAFAIALIAIGAAIGALVIDTRKLCWVCSLIFYASIITAMRI